MKATVRRRNQCRARGARDLPGERGCADLERNEDHASIALPSRTLASELFALEERGKHSAMTRSDTC
jgi:hypothetical protein